MAAAVVHGVVEEEEEDMPNTGDRRPPTETPYVPECG